MTTTPSTCTAIVCAYNEEKNLGGVLDGLLASPFVSEIIVVDDGSKDGTADILRRYAENSLIRPILLQPNRGKGYAMAEGAARARNDILLFVDADLVNWNAVYGRQVLEPLWAGRAGMVLGCPSQEKDFWDTADLLHIQRWLSGERAMRRSDILPILDIMRCSRFGVETILNMHYRILHKPIHFVMLAGLIHPIKFEKSPRDQALAEYRAEILEILRVFVRHPKMTAMNVIPDLYDMRDALLAVYGLLRRGTLA
jgi:glycosyltransferase involved in cell wall biosynthesis